MYWVDVFHQTGYTLTVPPIVYHDKTDSLKFVESSLYYEQTPKLGIDFISEFLRLELKLERHLVPQKPINM